MIDSERGARLTDFGLAVVIDESTAGRTTNHCRVGGTTRWMAPEMIYPEKFGFTGDEHRKRLPSRSTDIYALGMTILEVSALVSLPPCVEILTDSAQVITGRYPFYNISRDVVVMCKVLEGGRPDRPLSGFSDRLWESLTTTWLEEQGSEPSKRPTTSIILDRLREDVHNWGKSVTPPALVQLQDGRR